MPDVKVVSRPPVPSETYVPEALIKLLISHGLRPTWQKHTAELMSTYHGIGMRPVTGKLLEELKYEPSLGEFFITPEGFIQKLDCVLMVQPEAQWKERQAWKEEVTRRHESGSRHVDALNAEIEELVRRTGVPLQSLEAKGKLHPGATRVPDALAYIGKG